MRTTNPRTGQLTMGYSLRHLEVKDVQQCTDIENNAFPTHIPPTNFHQELKNHMANYLVAEDLIGKARPSNQTNHPQPSLTNNISRLLFRKATSFWNRKATERNHIVGLLGIWLMAGEAHIVSFAVRKGHRGQGVGELLLIGTIEHAMASKAINLTLEVRPSNMVARNLYRKYGFTECGTRRRYYADNGEDAVIMSTEHLDTSTFQDHFQKLESAHRMRWGISQRTP